MINSILAQFPIGDVHAIANASTGLINNTFFIETSKGRFVLQRLSKIFDERTVEDMHHVTMHLVKKGVPTVPLVLANDGRCWAKDGDGHLWKLMQAIDGVTYDVIKNPQLAYEAGKILGEFIEGMRDFDAAQLQNPIRLHQSAKIYEQFLERYQQLMALPLPDEAKAAFTFIKDYLPRAFLPDTLPCSTVHGDPKISNVIFNHGKAVCMIDLDTCMAHTPLVDIGDALRSWCGREEDARDNMFSLPIFTEAVRGLLSTAHFTTQEITYIHQSAVLIILELAVRFANDIVDDSYFGWNDKKYTSRREHNTARVVSLVLLARDCVAKEEEARRIVASLTATLSPTS